MTLGSSIPARLDEARIKIAIASLALLATLCLTASSAGAESWKVDGSHTTVGFRVAHLFTSVQGRFDEFAGSIDFDPANPSATQVKATVAAASINSPIHIRV